VSDCESFALPAACNAGPPNVPTAMPTPTTTGTVSATPTLPETPTPTVT
jgi:hypothetical protein